MRTSTKNPNNSRHIKLIYNSNAGRKRQLINAGLNITLEEIQTMFDQYQIQADFYPTKSPGHGTILAKEAINEGYRIVIAAGGDGTISEVANGLVGSEISLGILPIGSYMNIAKMLSIPNDLEKAVMIIKLNRTRKIDVGQITEVGGKTFTTNNTPNLYFIENASIGIEAEFQKHFLELEKGSLWAVKDIIKLILSYYIQDIAIKLDHEEIKTKAMLTTISNGPFTGANIPLAPDAKLNDHLLTVQVYKMPKWELIWYFLKLIGLKVTQKRKIKIYQSKRVEITTKSPRMIHADAKIFDHTPANFEIVPNALHVISGFPKANEHSLLKRTLLDP